MKTREQDEEELRKLREEIEEIKSFPLSKKIKEDRAAETLIKRTLAKHDIDGLQKELEEYVLKQAEVEELVTKLKKLDDERRELQAAISEKQGSFMRGKLYLENEIRQQRQILLESYDPVIDETIQFFRNKLNELRKPGRISFRGMNVERNLITETKTIIVETNENALHAAMSYCQDTIKLLETLKLSVEFHVEKIQELKDNLPSIDLYREVSGKRPIEDNIPRFDTIMKNIDIKVDGLFKKIGISRS